MIRRIRLLALFVLGFLLVAGVHAAEPLLGLAGSSASTQERTERPRIIPRDLDRSLGTQAYTVADLIAKLDSRASDTDLIPDRPEAKDAPVYLGDDLMRVPEVVFEAQPKKPRDKEQWTTHITNSLAKAIHLNYRRQDGFTRTLIRERRDLTGLPFLLGDACRKPAERNNLFQELAIGIRQAGNSWSDIGAVFDKVDERLPKLTRAQQGHAQEASIAVLTQIMGEGTEDTRLRLVKHLAATPHSESTRELARLAVFAPEKDVRKAAVKQLSVRRERDYTCVLVKALRYPWPGVAENAIEAIVALEQKELYSELVALLEEADPRLPTLERIDDRRLTVTSELVRINHHKSCLLCHAPAGVKAPEEALTAPVPLPTEPFPTDRERYSQKSQSPLLVRVDITYLRQDFSQMQEVKDAAPWPSKQRFDFLVRKRILSDAEAKDLREKLKTNVDEGELSPYQKAAVKALRELTGRDLPARAEAWRKLLKLPAKSG